VIQVQETGAVAETPDYRTRILDAAEACLMEERMSAPLHARIAERAGLSRPTVYKYVGDQEEIFRAVLERHALQYVVAVGPELERHMPLPEHFAHLTAFSVDFFRSSPVIAAVLGNDGSHFLDWLTSRFEGLIRDAVPPLVPLLHERLAATRERALPLEELLEWGVRLTLSLVFMPSAFRPLRTRDEIEEYVLRFVAAFGAAPQ